MADTQVDKPLLRKAPWVRWRAAYGFPLRIFYCQRCGEEEQRSTADGIDEVARAERRFARKHARCAESGGAS